MWMKCTHRESLLHIVFEHIGSACFAEFCSMVSMKVRRFCYQRSHFYDYPAGEFWVPMAGFGSTCMLVFVSVLLEIK